MAITDSLTHHQRTRIEAFFDQHGLTSVYDLQLPFPLKNAENFENADLDRLLSYCIKNNIDPGKIVISESTLNVLHNTPFIHVHFPINLINHYTLQESIEQTPTKHFNYLAGNYHYDRYMLLQGFMENDLLDNMHWSAYRNINTDIHRHHHFTNEFLDFCKTNTPRTLVQLNSHNCYPEDILDSNLYVDGAFIKDANNMDNQIFSDSAITITVDTMANTLPKLYNSTWHDISKETNLTMFYTAKIIKPIKHKRPFINLIGKGKDADKYLTSMGFQTFNSIWNEDYYSAETPKERVDQVVNLCYNLSKQSAKDIFNDTKDICNYNYNILTQTDWIEWYLNQIQQTFLIKQAIT